MTNVIRVETELNETANEIGNIIINNQKNGNISIRKITDLYNISANENSKKTISKSKVHIIIKKVLKYTYRKTNPKAENLNSDIS